ncbi:uncharacterized protein LOC107422636 isoform X1 [Ziziphus jujuba]|uniref:Uncharacterized protein LOC107422636 isoform X1 n=1 Tax=Ziziphus jujuba TaxID=326968 RepID=A0ABM4ABS3_ZIZJJ|nr:uncharacterized protein LOC107422636 isoform X1 [Ziziphus jujuba]XP_024931676.3 uncharacterized protein LOC107422636 isoform X1 [Ziziphus jujuba]XP_060674178.1 uncharacterized protein LOC107422636 isoform X1 [Ziziphus jujuba]XP_060674179.1 uncharacterized protein LOC107422636 isoform X1 [Ziziphus jujuba]XP_060674180.1 uncharacterized protein LOC107422636 isoform X1 [Ziziphus jujuba]XP_060674181.1 uncharacterized protein LOC107422636 isoform X1 [Ziziphus jujuba]
MGSFPGLVTELYRAALEGDWERMKGFYEENREAVFYPLTVTNDTAFHIAVYSGTKSPLEELIQIVPNPPIAKADDKKNTPLHEAGAIGNIEAAQVLMRCSPEQLEARNALGETPMFRAAAFGMTEMVKYLAFEVRSRQCDMHIQRIRDDNTSILHSAIHGQHFETALWLFKNDEILGDLMDNKGMTCLQLLAYMPSAFKSGYPMGKFASFIYFCLQSNEHDDDKCDQMNLRQCDDLESGWGRNHLRQSCFLRINRAIIRMYSGLWTFLPAGWPMIGNIQNEKKKHESSWKLAKLLIKKDKSWEKTDIKPDIGIISFGETKENGSEKAVVSGKKEDKEEKDDNNNPPPLIPTSTTPLLIATSTGIVEIVNEILEEYPQAVEHVSDQGLSIMHVAIRYRQRDIFKHVKKMKIPMTRLVRRIDNNGYTLLHHVSDMTHRSAGTLPNPALQLQDELKWFERVRKLIPSHYAMNHSRGGQTAQEIFEKSHAELLKEAQNWLKRTSESCSVIAVLIATVAFTAAYTVPGGSDQSTGLPILRHDPFFAVFTVMDVLSLVSSLTSVVMFISILTSPFRLQDFRKSLPRKLTVAFTFLFLAVAVTMLAFSATVILIVHMKKRWTTTIVYGVAFVPVTVFALLQFPLYVAFMGTVKYSLSIMKKALPWNFLRPLFCKSQY